MHIQKNIMHWFAWILIATTLINLLSKPLTVQATFPMTAEKLIDMCLTRSGKVVNSDMREDITNQVRNVLNGTATSYKQYLEDNGLQNTTENFRAYLESDAYASLAIRFVGLPLELGSFISWITTGETTLDQLGTDIEDVLTEEDESGNISVPSETVNIINQAFNNVKGDYTSGWKYIDTKPSSDIPTSFFGNANTRNAVIDYINSSEYPVYVFAVVNAYSTQYNTLYFSDNSESTYMVIEKGSNFTDGHFPGLKNGGLRFQAYNQSWENDFKAYMVRYDASQFSMTEEDLIDVQSNSAFGSTYEAYYYKSSDPMTVPYCVWGIYSKNGDKTIVYDNLQAIKDYSVGNTPYYLTNRQYSDSVDNSFNVSGEYIQNSGGTFAYEQIREQINNSNVTNDNSVSNIVNDFSQTIINNYNYSSGSGDGDNGDSGGNGILNGLGSVVEGLAEILGFLLKAIGEILGLIGNLFNTLLEGIKALGGIFAGFSGLLGELFPFIPTELMTFVTISIEAVIAIAVWKFFKK